MHSLLAKTLNGSVVAASAMGLLIALSASASAVELPDGNYECWLSNMMLGVIQIEGDTYRGPAFDGNYEGDHTFELTDAGTINWGGPLGGMSTGGNTVTSTVLKDAGGGRVGFDVQIQNARGNFQTISCSPQ